MIRAAPFVLIALAFATGIWLAAQYPIPLWFSLLVAVLAVVGMVAARSNFDATVILAVVFCLTLGVGRYTVGTPEPPADSPAAYSGRFVTLDGAVCDEPDVRPAFTYLRVQIQRMIVSSAIVQPQGIVLVRIRNAVPWQYGDVVRASGYIDDPPVIGEFDYRDYLAHKGVRVWLPNPESAQRIGTGQCDQWAAALLRTKAALRLSSQQIMPAPESALLNGVLIGDDNELPAPTQTAFRRTGTSHIVAISGFNVSIVI